MSVWGGRFRARRAARASGCGLAACLFFMGSLKVLTLARAVGSLAPETVVATPRFGLMTLHPLMDFVIGIFLAKASFGLMRNPGDTGTVGLAAAGVLFWAYFVFGVNSLDSLTTLGLVLTTAFVVLVLAADEKDGAAAGDKAARR